MRANAPGQGRMLQLVEVGLEGSRGHSQALCSAWYGAVVFLQRGAQKERLERLIRRRRCARVGNPFIPKPHGHGLLDGKVVGGLVVISRHDVGQRDFERNTDLSEKGLISEGDFEKIKYELEALQASYNLAKLELDYTQIRAPIDGIISERFIKLGNTVGVNDPVFHITSFEPLVAYLHVPEREYRNIRQGQAVAIEIDALSGAPIQADVTRVSPIVDPETGTFKITIEIYDQERRIKPGMFGRVSVVYDQHTNVLQVPRSAIVERYLSGLVFLVITTFSVDRSSLMKCWNVRTGGNGLNSPRRSTISAPNSSSQ